MKAKKFLLEIRSQKNYIQSLQEEAELLWSMATSITTKPKEVNVQSSGGSDNADTVVKIVEMNQKIEDTICEYVKRKEKALSIINEIDDLRVRTVMIKYYLQNKTFEQIAEETEFSYRWVFELNDRGLEEFSEKFEKN